MLTYWFKASIMRNIAVALDFQKGSGVLLNKASELAHAFGAKIWLLHIAEPEPDFVGLGVGPTYVRNDWAKRLKKEHHRLDELKKEFVNDNIETEALMIQGSIVETLLEELEKLDIDLLIIGKKGHGAMYRTFIGSVLTEVIKKTSVPTLAVPFLDEN